MNQARPTLSKDFSDVSYDVKEIEWKVRDILSLPDSVGYKMRSPQFSFADATWELQMYPWGYRTESEGYITLGIYRMQSRIPEHYVSYIFWLRNRRGKECENRSYSSQFNKDTNCWITIKYMKKSKLIEMKKTLAPNGVLTIKCEMRTEQIAGSRRYSTIESTSFQIDNATGPKLSGHLYDNKILNDFKELFLKQEDCDVIIKVKEKDFPAHKLILKARSSVFASTFRNDMKEKSTGIVNIEDCDPSTFSNFLSFIYSADEEHLSVENMFSLFITADKYDVQDLREKCLKFIKENLSLDTFCDTISIALLHSETELVQLSTDFFAKNFQDILVTVQWQQFLAENPTFSNELLIKALVPKKIGK